MMCKGVAALAVMVTACGGGASPADDAGYDACSGDCPAECTMPPCEETVAIVPYDLNRDLDLLFVIDNSGSMAEEQTSMQQSFSQFIDVLAIFEGGLPNVHIGVVSTDVGAGPYVISGCSGSGDDGVLQSAPRNAGCSPPAGQFISDIANPDGTRSTNYTGDLVDVFGCIARLGIDGCGFEQPLESARRALNGSNAENAGFLREGALLAVIFITDEDDCSTENTQMFDTSQDSTDDPLGPLSSFRCFEFGVVCNPDDPRVAGPRADCAPREDSEFMYAVGDYVDFFKGLKSDPTDVVVAGIIGNPTPVVVGADANGDPAVEPSCASASGEAAPGIRLHAFLSAFPQRSTVSTICNQDLSGALVRVGELVTRAVRSPCLIGDIKTDPIECTVSDVRFVGAPGEERVPLPECDDPDGDLAGNQPCWLIYRDAAQCPDTTTGLVVETYPADRAVPPETSLVVECLVNGP